MVHEYIKYAENKNKYQTLNPKIEKIFLKNALTVVSFVILMIILLLILHFTVGLDVFLVVFETLGATINPSKILLYVILGITAITMLTLLGNYLITRKVRYDFYQDKVILYKNNIFSFKPKEIPYQNIVKILGNADGIFNKLFNSGTIVLELSGMGEDGIELEFIDNVDDNVKYIQNLIQEWKSIRQEEIAESYKIDKVVQGY